MTPTDRPTESTTAGGGERGPMVCVIDDDMSVLRALRRLIGAGGFDVETFASAEDFLEFPRRGRAACLVLDIHLGGLSGFELHERLLASGSRVPVLFITALDDAATRERARQAGAVEYLRKPFDDDILLGAIRRAVRRGEPEPGGSEPDGETNGSRAENIW